MAIVAIGCFALGYLFGRAARAETKTCLYCPTPSSVTCDRCGDRICLSHDKRMRMDRGVNEYPFIDRCPACASSP